MKRLAFFAAGLGAFAMTSTATAQTRWESPSEAPDDSETPAEAEPRVRSGFSAKIDAGPAYYRLTRHDLFGFQARASLGAQIRDIGAIHGNFGVMRGESDGLLDTTILTFDPSWSFIFDRWRLGLGPQFTYVVIDRVTRDDAFNLYGGAGRIFTTVDLVASDHANLTLGLTAQLGAMTDDVPLFGSALSLGGRFKAP